MKERREHNALACDWRWMCYLGNEIDCYSVNHYLFVNTEQHWNHSDQWDRFRWKRYFVFESVPPLSLFPSRRQFAFLCKEMISTSYFQSVIVRVVLCFEVQCKGSLSLVLVYSYSFGTDLWYKLLNTDQNPAVAGSIEIHEYIYIYIYIGRQGTNKQTNKLHGLSPRANYTDRATAACRRSDCQLLRIKVATWSAWRIPTAVFSAF
jgi:hypothetical protein